jgi:hypothetical protein
VSKLAAVSGGDSGLPAKGSRTRAHQAAERLEQAVLMALKAMASDWSSRLNPSCQTFWLSCKFHPC